MELGGPREQAPARSRAWLGWPAAVALAAAWFLLCLPLVGRSEWEDDAETRNVATALESRWSGNYAVPTLQSVPCLNEPPLLPWLTAASISTKTADDLHDPDESVRRAALWRLAFEARLPTHIMSALLLLAVYGLGRTTCSPRCGLIAAAVCATMLLFHRYGRFASFDVPLALFVAAAQIFLARWIFEGRRWEGAIGGGLALGLGLLSKGPIVLLFAVVPVLAYLPLRRKLGLHRGAARTSGWALPVILMAMLTVAPILPWMWAVASSVPNAWSSWYAEITRHGATAAPTGKWYAYVELLRLCLPWTIWVIAGGVLAWRDFRRRHDTRGAVLVLLWVVVPLVVMALARDRKPHDLLPLVAPLAVLAARALDHHWREFPRWDLEAKAVAAAHWLTLVGFATATFVNADSSASWPMLLLLAVVVTVGASLHRRWRGSLIVATVLVVAMTQVVEGRRAPVVPDDRAELRAMAREIARRTSPSASLFIHAGSRMLAVGPAAQMELLLGRPIRWAPDPETARREPAPLALIVIHSRGAPIGADPAGWASAGRWPVGENLFELLVPPARTGTVEDFFDD